MTTCCPQLPQLNVMSIGCFPKRSLFYGTPRFHPNGSTVSAF
jgi:hypothetical protein